jgi:hypothetical protein
VILQGVSEGYRTHRFLPISPDVPPSARQPMSRSTSVPVLGLLDDNTIDNTPIFRSANDTLHAVYSQSPNTGQPHIAAGATSMYPRADRKKRVHAQAIIDEEDEEDVTGSEDKPGPDTDLQPVMPVSRPIKPLRVSARRSFGQTQSLPANMFSGTTYLATPSVTKVREEQQEEEDWSASAFAQGFAPGQTGRVAD